MYETKTKPNNLSVKDYLANIENETRRKDCEVIAALMERITGCAPRMWGSSIVGFDSYHYKYASGHEGDACVVGFSSRKSDITIYLVAGFESADAKALLARLGKHKLGKVCLYIKCLADIDLLVLEQLTARSAAETRRHYPTLQP